MHNEKDLNDSFKLWNNLFKNAIDNIKPVYLYAHKGYPYESIIKLCEDYLNNTINYICKDIINECKKITSEGNFNNKQNVSNICQKFLTDYTDIKELCKKIIDFLHKNNNSKQNNQKLINWVEEAYAICVKGQQYNQTIPKNLLEDYLKVNM